MTTSQKLSKKIASDTTIPSDEGLAGVCLRAGGVNTADYKMHMGDYIVFSKEGWEEFLVRKNLQVG